MPAVRHTHEPELGQLRGQLGRDFHHDIDVVCQERLALDPEIDGHASDHDRMDAQRCGNNLNQGNDLQRAFNHVGGSRYAGKVGA